MKKSKKLFSVLICFSMIFSSLSATIVASAKNKTYGYKAETTLLNQELMLSPGDLNGDGDFNAFDIVLMKKVIFGSVNEPEIINFADCNGDNETDILDTVILKNHISNIGAIEFDFTVENGKAVITGYKNSVNGAVTIPCEIGGYPVTEIADRAFEDCAEITSLLIPSSVKKIGANAFNDCDGITGLALPDSVISLGEGAFESCEQLSTFRLSEKTEEIGARAFLGCYKLKNVSMPITVTTVGDFAFCECFSLLSVKVPFEAAFGFNVFSGCGKVVVKGFYGAGGIDSAIHSGVGYELMECGHTEFLVLYAMNPTCSRMGYTGDKYCIDCGKIVVKGEDISKTSHISELINYSAETCAKAGYSGDIICIVCNETITAGKVIPALPHNFETVNTKAATCTQVGYTGDKICKDCGNTVKGETISLKEHNYGTEVNKKSATCTENGYTGDKTCKDCGKIVSGETIPATGHSYGALQNKKDATCTENGYTGDKTCNNCGHTIKGSTITATGHNYGALQNKKDATCTENGYTGDKSCNACGHTIKGSTITATGHSYGALQNKKDATCTANGYTGDKTCGNCGHTVKGETISAKGHSYGSLKNKKSATCTADGYTGEKTCSVCSYVLKGETIPATGHSYSELQGKVSATCTTDGYTGDKVCATCGDTVKGKTIPKTNHSWACNDSVNVICSRCSTKCSHANLVFGTDIRIECEVCKFVYCSFCNGWGHEEKNCSNRCTYCGGTGHEASACSYSTIKKGATGDVVKKLQTMLNAVNNAGLTVDGDFGGGTETAVKNFQNANGLTADGIVGSNTWKVLIEKYGSENGLKIAAGNYNPVSLVQGSSYSINGKITSSNKITSVTVGVYYTNGTATSVIASATPNAKSYNISALDAGLKFGSLSEGTYYFVVKATDTVSTRVLVKNKFEITTDLVKALKDRALGNWVAPVKKTGFYSVTSGGRYFGASRDSGNRAHAGVDIHYSNGLGIPIYAMESGKVIEYISNFYGGMQAIAVQHADGSIARYCEISTSLRKGDTVTKGEQIATIAKSNIGGDTMLHLEIYMGTATGSLTNSSNTTYDYVPNKNYSRRRDIVDPIFVFDLIQ